MSGETAGCLVRRRADRADPRLGPAPGRPRRPSAPEPEAASWADGGPPSPASCPWRHLDAATMPARRGQSTYPELTREITAHGGIDPERAHPAGG